MEVGAYVLGALSPEEHAEFDTHLETCEICQAEVDELIGLPALLGRIDLATAEAIAREAEGREAAVASEEESAEPATVLTEERPVEQVAGKGPTAVPESEPTERYSGTTVVATIDEARRRRAHEKRRRRIFTIGAVLAAACLALVVGLGAGRAIWSDSGTGTPPNLTAMTPVGAAEVPVAAQISVTPVSGGTRVVMQCQYGDGSGPYVNSWLLTLVVVAKSGIEVEVTPWKAKPGDEFQVAADTTMSLDQIDRVEIRKADGTPLLKYTV